MLKCLYMKRQIFVIFFILVFCSQALSASMFDENGNYSGNWKQMTNVSNSSGNRYSSSNYSTSQWYANNNKQRAQRSSASYSNPNANKMEAVPFRYNTLDYTRVRKVKGGYGDYSSRCSDIGDASFCH